MVSPKADNCLIELAGIKQFDDSCHFEAHLETDNEVRDVQVDC
jgi:hypothetical protein